MTITLEMLQARAVEQVQSDDTAETLLDSGAAGTAAMFGEYLLSQGVDLSDTAPKGNKVYEIAAETLRVAFRSQYCNKPRFMKADKADKATSKKTRKPVNMVLAREVLDTKPETRETWAKDSEQRKIWDAIGAFGRTKLQRVALVLWPKIETGDTATAEAGEDATESTEVEVKEAPTADAILANIDAFIAKHGKDSMLSKNLRDQINLRFK
jgi:hypothetical protein